MKYSIPPILAVLFLAPAIVRSQDATDRPAIARPAAKPAAESTEETKKPSGLPAALLNDDRTEGAVNAVRTRLEEMDTDALIRAAQARLRNQTGNPQPATTITNTTTPPAAGKPRTPAPAATVSNTPPPAAKPVPAPAPTPTPAPMPVASPTPAATPAPPTAQPLIPEPVANAPRATPDPAPAPVATPVTPASAPVTEMANAPGAPPAPIPLRPRYDREKGTKGQTMEITSRESIMDDAQKLVTFIGDVYIDHPGFKLRSDHLQVFLNETDAGANGGAQAADSGDKPPFQRAIATGAMVEIERLGADGEIQIAKARRADYDGVTGEMVLTGGPPTLQSGQRLINPQESDARIILTKDGKHQVKGVSTLQFSVPQNGEGSNKTMSIPLGGGLDSITNRNKSGTR